MGEQIRRIVLLGKTGSGKSSLSNTLFGEKDLFKVSGSATSETKLCKSEIKTIHGRSLQLIDTPGVFDTDPDCPDLSPELLKCIVECAPGPHAFLLVLQMGRFTKQEQDVVDLILKYFSEEALKFTTVVFTHGDQLDEGQKIEQWVEKNGALDDLVMKCGGRCHVFDNKYWKTPQDEYRNNQNQITQLLTTINQTVRENGGGCYTNDILKKAQKKIEKNKKKIQQKDPTISPTQASQMAKEQAIKELQGKVYAGAISTGAALGALVGTVGGPVGAAVGAGVGAAVGAGVGFLVNLFS